MTGSTYTLFVHYSVHILNCLGWGKVFSQIFIQFTHFRLLSSIVCQAIFFAVFQVPICHHFTQHTVQSCLCMSQPSYKKVGGEPVFGPAEERDGYPVSFGQKQIVRVVFFPLIDVVMLILEGASKLFFAVLGQTKNGFTSMFGF